MKPFDPMATVLSAIRNASSVPITADQVLEALRHGAGEPSHLRALFGDASFETLIRVGIQHGISNDEIGRAYGVAVRAAGARNVALDRPGGSRHFRPKNAQKYRPSAHRAFTAPSAIGSLSSAAQDW
jgi:hypothetical protein